MGGSFDDASPSDRWAMIVALVDLRIQVLVHGQWPRHGRLAWLAQEEAALQAFELGMRWAELDGHGSLVVPSRRGEGRAPLPSLIADVPMLAEPFRAGYGLVVGDPACEPEHLLLSVFQAAEYLGRAEHDVLMLMNEGVLACQWYGGERRVSFKDLEVYRVRDREDEARAVEALLIVAGLIEQRSAIRAA